jgi:hypothetical protein
MKKLMLFFVLSLIVFFASGQTAYINGSNNQIISICDSTTIMLTASISGGSQPGDTISWAQRINGTGVPVTLAHVVYDSAINVTVPRNPASPTIIVPAVYGNYYEYWAVIKRSGTNYSAHIRINVNQKPTVVPTTNDTVSICNAASTILSTNTGVGYTYQWQSSPVVHPGIWTNVPINGNSNAYVATSQQWYRVVVSYGGCSASSNW